MNDFQLNKRLDDIERKIEMIWYFLTAPKIERVLEIKEMTKPINLDEEKAKRLEEMKK